MKSEAFRKQLIERLKQRLSAVETESQQGIGLTPRVNWKEKLKWRIENMMGNTAPPPGAVQLSTYTPQVRSPNEDYKRFSELVSAASYPSIGDGLASFYERLSADAGKPIRITRAPESFSPEMASSYYTAQFRTLSDPLLIKAEADAREASAGRKLTRLERAFGEGWNELTPEQRGAVLREMAKDVPSVQDSRDRIESHGGWNKFVKNLATSWANQPRPKAPATPPEPKGMTQTGPNTWIKVTPYGTIKVRRVEKGQ